MAAPTKTARPFSFLSSGALGTALALGAAQGCNGCTSNNHDYPVLDAAAEYPLARGSVGVSVDVDDCPARPIVQLSPASARVGAPVVLTTPTSLPDAGTWTLTWSASPAGSGAFDDASSPRATFTCKVPGPITLTLSLSKAACATTQEASFYCLAPSDAGAANPGTGGTTGMTGTGGSTGMTGTGGSTGVANRCPDSEPIPDGNGAAACLACLATNCSLAASPAGTDGCCGLAKPADQALCAAVFTCIVSHAKTCTAAESGDATNCFCGTSGGDCFKIKNAANGPCVAAEQAAAKSTEPATLQAQFMSPASPLGRANNLSNCMGSFCKDECAFGK